MEYLSNYEKMVNTIEETASKNFYFSFYQWLIQHAEEKFDDINSLFTSCGHISTYNENALKFRGKFADDVVKQCSKNEFNFFTL